MPDLLFLEPTTVSEAVAGLQAHGPEARVLAGGTAVVLFLQQKLISPAALVSLAHIPGLRAIEVTPAGELRIGALAPLAAVAADERVRRGWPALAQACASAANVRIRNQATLGGNLAEADYASDPPAALVALEGVVHLVGPAGERHLPLGAFFLGLYTTALAEGEIVTRIHVPAPAAGAASTYLKYKSRSSEDRPCVGVAAEARFAGPNFAAVRLAVGAACETPQRQPALEQALAGQPATPTVLADFAHAFARALPEPLTDLRGSAAYRRAMAAVHIERALAALASRGGRL
jgi:carbon-monoxide dehydrogenase medium subunit